MRDDYQSGYDDMDYQDPYNQQPTQPQAQLDPAVEKVRRKLMRLMMISIGITIVLILIILAAVIYKVTSSPSEKTPTEVSKTEASPVPGAETDATSEAKTTSPAVPEFIRRSIALPQGTRILSQSLSNDMIALETLTPEGNTELVIYDYRQGHLVAGITVDTSPVAKQPVEEPTPQSQPAQ